MVTSSVVVFLGLGLGWWIYGNKVAARRGARCAGEGDAPPCGPCCADKFYIDELYGATVIAFYHWWAQVAADLDRSRVWGGIVAGRHLGLQQVGAVQPLPRCQHGGRRLRQRLRRDLNGGGLLARCRPAAGRLYLRLLALAVVVLAAILIWSSRWHDRSSPTDAAHGCCPLSARRSRFSAGKHARAVSRMVTASCCAGSRTVCLDASCRPTVPSA